MADTVLPEAGTPFGDRVRKRLTEARVVWLTTVGRDGTPQPNPVWFLWEGGDTLLVYNRADANRLTHVAGRPRVSVNLDSNGSGGDIVVLTGVAERVDELPRADANPAYLAKYQADAERVSGGTVADFAAQYPVPLQITIGKVRGF